jgi:hypothetical protein
MRQSMHVLIVALLIIVTVYSCTSQTQHEKTIPQIPPYDEVNNKGQTAEIELLMQGHKLWEKVPIHPLKLAGSIAWVDSQNPNEPFFTRLIPDNPLPEPEFESKIVFHALVDREFTVSSSFLSFLNAQLGNEAKAEVVLEYVFRAKGPDYNSASVQSSLQNFITRNNRVGRQFFYIEDVRYMTLTYKTYRKYSKGGGTGYFINIEGEYYHSDDRFSVRELVCVDWIKLDSEAKPIIGGGGGGGVSGFFYMR